MRYPVDTGAASIGEASETEVETVSKKKVEKSDSLLMVATLGSSSKTSRSAGNSNHSKSKSRRNEQSAKKDTNSTQETDSKPISSRNGPRVKRVCRSNPSEVGLPRATFSALSHHDSSESESHLSEPEYDSDDVPIDVYVREHKLFLSRIVY